MAFALGSAELARRGGLREHTVADRLAIAAVSALTLVVAIRWHNYQWDFYMFRDSAQDFARGVSPYRGAGLSFYHPPLTLYVYELFLRLPFPVAYELWLALKLAALTALFGVWSRRFLPLRFDWKTTLYFALAYNGTIYADFVSGNVSTFEQLGLWVGLAALLEKRYATFCACLIVVAQVKLTPIFFASLLLVVPARPQWSWFAACLCGFAALLFLNHLLHPELFRDFLRVAPALDERGTLAPGTLAFVRDVFDRIRGPQFSDRSRLDELVYFAVAAVVGVSSLVAIMRHRRSGANDGDAKLTIYFACTAYALMAPRMRVYSDNLLLIPTLHLLRALPRRRLVPAAAAALVILVVFPHGDSLLPFHAVSALLYEYLPLAGALAVWLGLRSTMGGSVALVADRAPLTPRALAMATCPNVDAPLSASH